MDQQEIMKKLQEPFHPDDIEWRVGATSGDKTKGIALAYVTNRAIQNRLDEVVGPFNWQNQFQEWKGTSQICGISIRFGNEWVTKWDGADDSNQDAVKGGLSDAMKRAGYQWGIGRYLYKLENIWVPIKQQGKSYVLAGAPPDLPAWALPEGYKKGSSKPAGGTKKQEERKATASEESIPTSIKKLFQDYTGALDNLEDWVSKQKAKKRTYVQMEEVLQTLLAEKQAKEGEI
ncbi:Rad52/Rad22 family DNA repair protein [Paenibacillus ehimensis]|uniref:Rad52/Rad22 family DNA repair protein n=1 Tax=Paenibacillus ehimensis TaxID=79264 RepID=UPI003D2C187D